MVPAAVPVKSWLLLLLLLLLSLTIPSVSVCACVCEISVCILSIAMREEEEEGSKMCVIFLAAMAALYRKDIEDEEALALVLALL